MQIGSRQNLPRPCKRPYYVPSITQSPARDSIRRPPVATEPIRQQGPKNGYRRPSAQITRLRYLNNRIFQGKLAKAAWSCAVATAWTGLGWNSRAGAIQPRFGVARHRRRQPRRGSRWAGSRPGNLRRIPGVRRPTDRPGFRFPRRTSCKYTWRFLARWGPSMAGKAVRPTAPRVYRVSPGTPNNFSRTTQHESCAN
jgi:hypothetical protein